MTTIAEDVASFLRSSASLIESGGNTQIIFGIVCAFFTAWFLFDIYKYVRSQRNRGFGYSTGKAQASTDPREIAGWKADQNPIVLNFYGDVNVNNVHLDSDGLHRASFEGKGEVSSPIPITVDLHERIAVSDSFEAILTKPDGTTEKRSGDD